MPQEEDAVAVRRGEAGRGGGEGVRTRDHLASARTFLAWARTGMVLMTVGYSLDKFTILARIARGEAPGESSQHDRVLGAVLVAAGVVSVLVSFVRFLVSRRMIEQADLRTRPWLDIPLLFIGAVGGLLVLGYLIHEGG